MIIKVLKSIKFSLNGLKHAYRNDKSFQMEIWSGVIFVLFAYILWPLSGTEILFLILSYLLILVVELLNTAFERILDILHPETDEQVGISKDIASTAVFIAIIFAVIVACAILSNHL